MSQVLTALPAAVSRRRFLQITAATGALALAGAVMAPALLAPPAKTRSAVRMLMGTRIHLTVVAEDSRRAETAITATFDAMARLIAHLDHRQPTSALATLNRRGYLAAAPDALVEVLQRAVAIGDLTAGAFDVTVKPVLDARQAGATDLSALRAVVDYRQIEIEGRQIRLGSRGAAITLDGIAKGRVIDGGVEALRQLGFDQVLVEAGGDLRTLGRRADGTPWRIGIAHPRHAAQGELLSTLSVDTQAVATSGDYMNTLVSDYSEHHIVDPHSGRSPVDLASATVLAATAMDADALGTALMVLGSQDGLALAERLPGVEAVLVTKDLRVFATSGAAVQQATL
jgi:thiamine biosynthesis lipoprotein